MSEHLSEEEQTVQDLMDADVDLSRPQKLEHYLSFPFASQAHAVGDELRGQGYRVVVDYDEESEEWLVILGHEIEITPRSLTHFRSVFEPIALGHGGEYVCWNVVVPDPDYESFAPDTE